MAKWNVASSVPGEAGERPWRGRNSTVWRSRRMQVGLTRSGLRWMDFSIGSLRCLRKTSLVFSTPSSTQGPPPFPTVFSDLLKQLQYFTVPSCLLSQPRCILTKFSAFNFQAYVRERSEMCVLLTYSNAVQGGLAQTAF